MLFVSHVKALCPPHCYVLSCLTRALNIAANNLNIVIMIVEFIISKNRKEREGRRLAEMWSENKYGATKEGKRD